MRVLVCEDQDAIRRMIETLVGSSGHEVVGVATGAKAVELASTERFDILLLDLMLPGALDGFEVCARLRAHEATKDLPIFVISAMDDPESRARVRDAGATAFYAKPFRPLELLKDIQAIAASRK
ncbi:MULTISPECIES: response regulator [Polyangium]|uniref:Response regulator n=1 Tax=Polyangium jinanense TaxID=2829994 RepID=A0A9X3X5X4_9BACT|nr:MULTISPECIES: response regulator [Polyangium]MDC3958300.1 response regulator [Polyangium jinanense]MDC3983365.1 response regulator [Polyangium jinanense]MDI3283973.1 response regulator [Polyangium sp. 15x6]